MSYLGTVMEANARIKQLEAELVTERERFENYQQAQPTVQHHRDGGYVWSNCIECGPDQQVDEDGCCVSCGRDSLCYGKEARGEG